MVRNENQNPLPDRQRKARGAAITVSGNATTLFRWKVRKVANPSSRWAGHISQFALLCNQCDASVISGAPYNDPGRRYFTLYAREAALEHLAIRHANALRLQPDRVKPGSLSKQCGDEAQNSRPRREGY